MRKTAEKPLAQTSGSGASWLSTLLNPVPTVIKTTDKYPAWLAEKASKRMGTKDNPGRGQFLAYMGSKALIQGLMAFATVYGLRRLRSGIKGDDPSSEVESQLDSTYEPELKKDAAEVPPPQAPAAPQTGIGVVGRPGPGSIENLAAAVVPSLALLSMAAYGWTKAGKDIKANSRAYLKDRLKRREAEFNNLLGIRAMVAKGTATREQVEDALKKDASMDKSALATEVVGALTLLGAAVYAGSAIGAYKYFSKSNPDNLKLKALEKGLAEYAKVRSDMTPVSIVPKDSDEFFRKIDEGDGVNAAQQQEASPDLSYAASRRLRVAPEVADARRGVSVSL